VPVGRRRPGLLFAPLGGRFCGRGAGVLCFVLARAPHAAGRGTVRCRAGAPPLGRRRARARVGRSRVTCVGVCAVSARAGWGRGRVGACVAGFRQALSLARSLALSLSLCLPGLSGMVHASDVHHWTKSTGRFTVTKSQSRSIQEWWRICRRFTPSWTQAAGMPPPEYSQVRSDELPVSMRMRMRVVMCGYACTCAREFNSASRP
jgi:hypothetical protein